MKAGALIDGAPFGSDTVKIMGEALDLTWVRIAPIFGKVPHEVDAARLKLAEAILAVITEGDTDVEDLKDRAIQAMAKKLRLESSSGIASPPYYTSASLKHPPSLPIGFAPGQCLDL